ncbi:ABC transporter ATP-binding protein [Gehongia tenuis]|uniref:ABC transporter ATP-binding protein n=1 Tax=Gehongia tenuis TaxID=2763655 RepID=A0A926D6D5_9FIRM|nr:ABC transporter ATP-binding protein [Gehongia tenuis]MBC8532224.1 ABC transporter ATP-binding protein [Gehongia tenuis]
MKKRLKMLWQLTKGNRILYGCAFLCVALSVLVSLVTPLIVRTVLDSIIGDAPLSGWPARFVDFFGGRVVLSENIWIAAMVFVLLNVLNVGFLYGRGKLSAMAAERIVLGLRERLYDHLQHLPYQEHVDAETGDWIQRCTSDVETVRRFFAGQLVEFSRGIFMLGIAIAIMVPLNWKMTLVGLCTVPIIFLYSFIFMLKIMRDFQRADEAEGRLSTVIQENLTGIRVVRAFGRQAFEKDKFDEANEIYCGHWRRLMRILGLFWSLGDLTAMTQTLAVLVFGSFLAVRGELSLGTFVVFITYEGMLLWPIRQMGRILADMSKCTVSIGRIMELLNKPLEGQLPDSVKPSLNQDIVFDNVYFEYEPGKPVLNGVSFNVNAGQTVAVLGSTGSGKSSLVQLLQRLYEYQGGSIRIGGVELNTIDKHYLRSRVGLVLQEPFLYSRSILENIAIAQEEAPLERVYEAARIAAVHEVIEEFDRGYDTLVGERGVTLSGGQKQRVSIARTLMADSDILIFDDSLSAVDARTDVEIRRALLERKKGVTTFIISHRVSTLSEADFIVVLEDGKVTELGTHEELIRRPGLYRRIYDIQSGLAGREAEA